VYAPGTATIPDVPLLPDEPEVPHPEVPAVPEVPDNGVQYTLFGGSFSPVDRWFTNVTYVLSPSVTTLPAT